MQVEVELVFLLVSTGRVPRTVARRVDRFPVIRCLSIHLPTLLWH